jgi:tRNA-splicing ligase RtcB
MFVAVAALMQRLFGINADRSSLIHCDHNHVQPESHAGNLFWLHRKGAQSAQSDEPGIVPGSMGTASFHTSGRGCASSLTSCSHGAGRRLSRTAARREVSGKDFARQVRKLWYDHRLADQLRDEAPAAYKDIRQVMKAQRELVRIIRELRPLLTYKGV